MVCVLCFFTTEARMEGANVQTLARINLHAF
jgi:hypothetical protein